jgi:hypothetical protein
LIGELFVDGETLYEVTFEVMGMFGHAQIRGSEVVISRLFLVLGNELKIRIGLIGEFDMDYIDVRSLRRTLYEESFDS